MNNVRHMDDIMFEQVLSEGLYPWLADNIKKEEEKMAMKIRTLSDKKITAQPLAGVVRLAVVSPGAEWHAEFSVSGARRLARIVGDILAGKNVGTKKVPGFDGKYMNVSRYDNPETGNANVMLVYHEKAGDDLSVGWTAMLEVTRAGTLVETMNAAAEIAERAPSDEVAAVEFEARRVFIAI